MIVRETTYDADTIADIKTATPRTVWFIFPHFVVERDVVLTAIANSHA